MVTPRKRSLTEGEKGEASKLPKEVDDGLYRVEVLQLAESITESSVDEQIIQEALELGLDALQDNPDDELDRPFSPAASVMTTATDRLRSGSTSEVSRSTAMSSRSSSDPMSPSSTHLPPSPSPSRRLTFCKSPSFNEYEKFIASANAQAPAAPKLHSRHSLAGQMPSLISTSTRRTSSGIKRGIRRLSNRQKPKAKEEGSISCVCCRDEFEHPKHLRPLPCAHAYCESCLHTIIEQAMRDESRMPPRCCNRPLPGFLVKAILSREEQQQFIKSVLQYATPWKDRIFCPNANCREFIPQRKKLDQKHPFEVVCKRCTTAVCKNCKREAHPAGQDCPADWELDAVLQMGENQGWRRCHKCRALVELTSGCVHMICRCRAEFCYICGAVWDEYVGCPNFCNGELELERRRAEEENQREQEAKALADQEAADAASALQVLEAAKRTADNRDLLELREKQLQEMDRFLVVQRKQRDLLTTRLSEEKSSMLLSQMEVEQIMKDRHLKLIGTLEDRQVIAEMELRQTLKQEHKSCLVRLRHMEAYCKGLNTKGGWSSRVITERDRQELEQQYSLRNNMERMHQARINVLRDKQAQQLEALVARQDEEWTNLQEKSTREMEQMEERFEGEENTFNSVFKLRRERLIKRWGRVEEIMRKRLELKDNTTYGPLAKIEWPAPISEPAGLDALHHTP